MWQVRLKREYLDELVRLPARRHKVNIPSFSSYAGDKCITSNETLLLRKLTDFAEKISDLLNFFHLSSLRMTGIV